ncbi:MAG TPA: DUF1918 domain-containing protein [Candidatus Dormibacteraeota bacterium]|nr:DUF1918 domain-containing protein [Candidatus Dormibacteraeota bacterium]
MATGEIGDRLVVESGRVGTPAREGEIIEVLGTGDSVHYLVSWEDGHKSTFFPGFGSSTIVRRARKRGAGKAGAR